MTKIIKKDRSLEEEYMFYKEANKRNGLRALIFFLLTVICGISAAYLQSLGLTVIFMVALAAFAIIAISALVKVGATSNKLSILEAGIEGEEMASRCIKLLPDTYTAFRNLFVCYDGRNSEMDLVIVGPTGVFVVEIKNQNGRIYGDAADRELCQYKIGRAGTPYVKTLYNPIKQVNTHVYRIANFLRENGVRTHVNAAVYFTNIEASVEISGLDEKCRVFVSGNDGARELMDYVLNNKTVLTEAECEKIVRILNV